MLPLKAGQVPPCVQKLSEEGQEKKSQKDHCHTVIRFCMT
jgi:hypothetical protein